MCPRTTVNNSRIIFVRRKLLLEPRDDLGKRIRDFRRHYTDERVLNILPDS